MDNDSLLKSLFLPEGWIINPGDPPQIYNYRGQVPQQMENNRMACESLSSRNIGMAQRQAQQRMAEMSLQQALQPGMHHDSLKQHPKEKSMFKEFKIDMKNFIVEHKGIIYGLFILLLVDHVFFKGHFKAKIQEAVSRMIGHVEKKIENIGVSSAPKQ